MVFIISVLKVLSLYTAYTAEKRKEHISIAHHSVPWLSQAGDHWDTAAAF